MLFQRIRLVAMWTGLARQPEKSRSYCHPCGSSASKGKWKCGKTSLVRLVGHPGAPGASVAGTCRSRFGARLLGLQPGEHRGNALPFGARPTRMPHRGVFARVVFSPPTSAGDRFRQPDVTGVTFAQGGQEVAGLGLEVSGTLFLTVVPGDAHQLPRSGEQGNFKVPFRYTPPSDWCVCPLSSPCNRICSRENQTFACKKVALLTLPIP